MKGEIYKNWKRIVASMLIITMFATSISLESIAAEPKKNRDSGRRNTSFDGT